ncbi:MAG: PAS domain S-box protein [Desulfobacteraceae bacterium]|nr:PAS domain S-box protein [Desulfobacteraceae bacterium]
MRIRKYILIVLCFFCFAFTNSPIHASERLEPVTIQLKWKHQFQFAGYYAAIEKGFYADLNKALAGVTEVEKLAMREKRVPVAVVPAEPALPEQVQFDQTKFLLQSLGAIFACMALIIAIVWLVKGRPRQLSIRDTLLLVSFVFTALIVSSVGFVIMLLEGERQHIVVAAQRDKSLNLAHELKQSSDDLTRFARTYVVTGDPKYEHYFQAIIAIRDGKQAHPRKFTRSYWDHVAAGVVELDQDGEMYSIEQRMIDFGFSEDETAKLLEAKKESDDLINLEDVAMNAIKGLYKDEDGRFTIKDEPDMAMARKLLHGKEYHDAKARIMRPIDQFFTLLEQRTGNELNLQHQRNDAIIIGITILIAITIGFSFYVFFLLRRRIILPLAVLEAGTKAIKRGDYSHHIELTSRDEIANLAKAFNSMGRSIEDRTQELHKLSRVTEASPDSIVITDSEGTIEYVNPKFVDETGYSVEEAIGQNPRILNSGKLPPEFYHEMWETIKSGRVWRGEFHNRKKNGELYWEYASISPIVNIRGEITHYVAVKEDITDRIQAEEALQERQRHKALEAEVRLFLTRKAPLSEVLQHCVEEIVEYLDAAFARVWTLNHEEQVLELQASAGLYTHLDGAHSRVPVGKFKIGLIASEKKPRLTNQVVGDPQVGEQEWAKREGMVAFAGYPLIVGEHVEGVMALFARYPLTQTTLDTLGALSQSVALGIMRQRAETAVHESEIKFRTLYEATDDAVMLMDRERFIDCNPAALKMFGCDTIEKFTTFHPADISPPLQPDVQNSFEAANQKIAEAFKKGSNRFEWMHKRLDGTEFPADVLLNVFELDGQPILDAVVRDITVRKQFEKKLLRAKKDAESANRAKSDFLANMSHEIRTPLNAVLGFLELVLEDTSIPERQRKHLTTAQSSAKGLLGLLNDILDISKLERDKLSIEQRPFNLSRLMEGIHKTMNMKAREKGLDLQLDIQPSLSGSFMGDPLRLRQIMINLVGNAVKFTEKGSVFMRIMPAEEEGQLHFMIEDTGIGIPADRLSQIFETFTQADTTTTRRFGGTGLGTTIARELVELMGGRIWAESEVGKGSTFHFTVTMAPTDQVPEGVGEAVSEDAMDISAPSGLELPPLAAALNTAVDAIGQLEAVQDGEEMPKKEMDIAHLRALFIEMLAAFDQFSPYAIEPFLAELKEYLSQDQLSPIVAHMERFDFDGAKQETVKLAKTLKIALEGCRGI